VPERTEVLDEAVKEFRRVEVARCRELAIENDYEMRIASVEVDGVFEMFELPELAPTRVSDGGQQ
jgi:hypothetical protein